MVVKSYSAVTFGGDGIRVYAPKNLHELYDFLLGKAELLPLEMKPRALSDMEVPSADFADVQGLEEGLEKGMEKGVTEVVLNMLKKKWPRQDISEVSQWLLAKIENLGKMHQLL